MKHTLEDIPALVKDAWKNAVDNDQVDFLSGDAEDIANDMLSADAFIEALLDDHDDAVVRPLVVAEVRKLQDDM